MEFDYASASGNILLWQIPGWYRLQSRVFCFVEAIDYQEGLDIFVPIGASHAELGADIRRCHAASRRVDIKDFPKPGSAALERSMYRAWERIALEASGKKSFSEFGDKFRAVRTLSGPNSFFFSNFRRDGDDLKQVLPKDPGYREFYVGRDSSDDTLGEVARNALAAQIE